MVAPRLAAASAALLAVLLVAAAPTSHAQAAAPSAFLGQLGAANTSSPSPAPAECSGSTQAKLIIQSVTPIPGAGNTAQVVIRNIGGQTANITGYRLTGTAGGNESDSSNTLYIANDRRCRENGTVPSGQSLFFKPVSNNNPCGFPFQLGSGGTVTLSDYNGAPVSAMSWTNATEGTEVMVTPDGSAAVRVPGNQNVIEVLRSLGDYQTFVLALQAAGLDQALIAASDPNYTGPKLPEQQYVIDLPWWFAGAQAAGAAPPPPPPPAAPQAPPPVGVPASGPYTIFAPNDDAFDAMLLNLGGGQRKLPLDQLLRLPQLNNILMYHIVPGQYTSAFLRNNTPIYTAQGVEVVPFADGCMTEGRLMLHDSCIDKPTADNYTCEEQRAFGKCDFPFMVSSLAAQWQGGFCQRTCKRCDCSPTSGIICSTVISPDVQANNGVIHGISRVLFPPPTFTKEQAIADAVAYNESLARNQSMGIAPAPGMTGLNDLPGAAAPITPGAPAAGVTPAAGAANGTGAGANPAGTVPGAAAGTTPAGVTPAAGAANGTAARGAPAAAAPGQTGTAPGLAPPASPEATPAASPAPAESPAPAASPAVIVVDNTTQASPPAGRRLQRFMRRQ
uniref:FAS1 domain-containing protein n=1 Tax=Tetradesmus obliquus TaxID=3088 RepID=A0A383WQB5_TETOB|eukprot:jgi/Sobl393_1/10148/SZX79484.1